MGDLLFGSSQGSGKMCRFEDALLGPELGLVVPQVGREGLNVTILHFLWAPSFPLKGSLCRDMLGLDILGHVLGVVWPLGFPRRGPYLLSKGSELWAPVLKVV